MHTRLIQFIASVVLALGLLPPARASDMPPEDARDTRIERFRAQIEAHRKSLGIPGLSVAILEDGELLWTQGLGHADLERRVPASPDTLYHIASITKTFTAILAWRLIEQGKLDLEAPVARWVPEIKDARVRIKHLLSHTSEGTPGEKFNYNPERFEHLKAILEQVAGKPLRQQFVETFIVPLQMRDSVPGPDLAEASDQWAMLGQANLERFRDVMPRQAKPYTWYGEGEILRSSYPPKDFWASAGLVSTVRDLAKYDAAVDRGALISGETRARAWRPFVSNAGQPLAMGLGWYVTDYRGQRLVWHFGHWGVGFSALYLKIPAERLTLLMLANSEALADHHYKIGEDITHDLFACAFIDTFVPDVKQRGAALPAAPAKEPDTTTKAGWSTAPAADCESSSREALAKWRAERRAAMRKAGPLEPGLAAEVAGRYQLSERAVTLSREGDRLFYEWSDGLRAEIFAEAPGRYFVKIRPWTFDFVREGGKVVRIDFTDGTQTWEAKRIR